MSLSWILKLKKCLSSQERKFIKAFPSILASPDSSIYLDIFSNQQLDSTKLHLNFHHHNLKLVLKSLFIMVISRQNHKHSSNFTFLPSRIEIFIDKIHQKLINYSWERGKNIPKIFSSLKNFFDIKVGKNFYPFFVTFSPSWIFWGKKRTKTSGFKIITVSWHPSLQILFDDNSSGKHKPKDSFEFQNNVSLISDNVFWFLLPQFCSVFPFSLLLPCTDEKVQFYFLLKEFFSDYVLGKRKKNSARKEKGKSSGKRKSLQISLLISRNFISPNCFTTSFS